MLYLRKPRHTLGNHALQPHHMSYMCAADESTVQEQRLSPL